MSTGYQRTNTGFSCNEIGGAVELQEQRAALMWTVRAYGEVLSLFSFMHLGLREPGMSLLFSQLSDRASEILDDIRHCDAGKFSPTSEHAKRHLRKVAWSLSQAKAAFERRSLASDTDLLRLLTRASSELKRASTLLGTTTFDASACCAGPVLANAEERHGSAFRLGA
ncbi:hypothetical protein CO661_16815 [Sinorhizobium fredii]|uniref:Uncharacterized protein n=1 Tax=Rhizobium fredii TaxID=380 RepID=A0A2A6LWH0_RHIFR|nr:hypothetical protein [Sinorhizobium fredii]PDT46576.1 hypothetical protein CO661_16815 [Sinorhizobium fredii]